MLSSDLSKQVTQRLSATGIAGIEKLLAVAEPAWRITTEPTPQESLAPGQSRFGGTPDVPAGFVWPARDGRPLAFLAQIDLRQVSDAALPAAGWLLFFYDVEDQPWGFDPNDATGWKGIFVEGSQPLARAPSEFEPAEPCALAVETLASLPEPSDSLVGHAFRPLSSADDDADAYRAALEDLSPFEGDEPRHQLLGHPHLIQNDMRRECALASNGINAGDEHGYRDPRAGELLANAAGEWRLLLQIDTDEAGPGWMWGDCGRLYFWIRRSDLAARAFDRVWCSLQCG